MSEQTTSTPTVDTTSWYLELDCPPGNPRPDAVLPKILEGTTLTPDDFTNTLRVFGNWNFVPKPEKLEEYGKCREILKRNISLAFENGWIRYGSW